MFLDIVQKHKGYRGNETMRIVIEKGNRPMGGNEGVDVWLVYRSTTSRRRYHVWVVHRWQDWRAGLSLYSRAAGQWFTTSKAAMAGQDRPKVTIVRQTPESLIELSILTKRPRYM